MRVILQAGAAIGFAIGFANGSVEYTISHMLVIRTVQLRSRKNGCEIRIVLKTAPRDTYAIWPMALALGTYSKFRHDTS